MDLVFKFIPRRLRAVKPRIDRTLLDDPVVKLKFQTSVVNYIDAAQKGQYAALTTQFPSMVAHTLPPGHPGTEFAPAGALDDALECAAKEHLEVVTSRVIQTGSRQIERLLTRRLHSEMNAPVSFSSAQRMRQ